MKIKSILNHIYERKWFDSAIYETMRTQLNEERCFVKRKPYTIASPRQLTIEVENFFVSRHLVTNKLVAETVNFLQIKNCEGGTYYLFNEYNPSLPLFWDHEKSCYQVKKGFEDHPVCGVSWRGALLIAFALGGRLPFELEWEVCATAGNLKNKYPWGNDAPSIELANYGEHRGSTSPVGLYPPNAWGLYDVAGNAEEWCMDWYYPDHPYSSQVPVLVQGNYCEKTVKGGSWNKGEDRLLCSARRGKWYRIGTVGIGFRIVWERQPIEKEVMQQWFLL